MERCLPHLISTVDILPHEDTPLELVDVVGPDGLHEVVLYEYLPVIDVPRSGFAPFVELDVGSFELWVTLLG